MLLALSFGVSLITIASTAVKVSASLPNEQSMADNGHMFNEIRKILINEQLKQQQFIKTLISRKEYLEKIVQMLQAELIKLSDTKAEELHFKTTVKAKIQAKQRKINELNQFILNSQQTDVSEDLEKHIE